MVGNIEKKEKTEKKEQRETEKLMSEAISKLYKNKKQISNECNTMYIKK